MTMKARLRGGNPAVVFDKIGDHIFGAYEGPDEWLPIRWNSVGLYIPPDEKHGAVRTPLDLVYGNIQPETHSDQGPEET